VFQIGTPGFGRIRVEGKRSLLFAWPRSTSLFRASRGPRPLDRARASSFDHRARPRRQNRPETVASTSPPVRMPRMMGDCFVLIRCSISVQP